MPISFAPRFTLALGLAAVLSAGVLAPASLAPRAAEAATTLAVSAGAESPGGDVQLNAFAPHTVTIATGDAITWRVDSDEFHTIHFLSGTTPPGFVTPGPDGVFLNPAVVAPSGGTTYEGTGVVGSGLLSQGETYTLSFPRAGTYEYVCLIHPDMKATIVVKDSREGTDTQASVDARRTAEVKSELANRGVPLIMSGLRQQPAEGVSATIAAGVGDNFAMVARFLPERVTVRAGDAVTWIWKDPETPHTVTFLGGQPAPELILPEVDGNGPPRLRLNPAVLAPMGDPTSFAGGALSSGFLDPTQSSKTPTFTVHFTDPGTYEYICALHEGMAGTIVVEG